VDVHVRRLRAKLGPEHEALIGTVRNVGYRFVPVKNDRPDRAGRGNGEHTKGGPHGGAFPGTGARATAPAG